MPMFTNFKKMYFTNIILGFILCISGVNVRANEPSKTEATSSNSAIVEAKTEVKSEKFDPGKLIMHHIADEHSGIL